MVPVHLLDEHVFRGQDVDAGPLGIVDDVPELPDEPLRVRQIHRVEGLVRPLLHAQQNDAAVGVGKGGVSLPDALGEAAQGLLRLDAVVLPVLFDLGKVDYLVSLRRFGGYGVPVDTRSS